MASHVHLARFLCAIFTVSLAGSVSALPSDMAAHLERTLVSGAGVMFPDETLAAVLNVGTAVVDDAWPAAFLARAGETVSVSISPDTGLYEFRDEDGTLFWLEAPFAPLTSNWVAPFLHPLGGGETDLLSPFRLAETWTLLDAESFRSTEARRHGAMPPSLRGDAPEGQGGVSSLAFTAFSLTPSNLTFTASWPTNPPPDGLPPPGGLLDLYCVTNLTERPWALLHTESVTPDSPEDGSLRVGNAYDHLSRRTAKYVERWYASPGEWRSWETHTFVYDGWNPILETVVNHVAGTTNTVRYLWGLDLSETLQGAGGVGGLVAVVRDGAAYFPCYDANGNVTEYISESGAVVASYVYDAFGNALSATGPMAGAFSHRFSTKYFDPETGLYYYGYRFYAPELGRWINRDPKEEEGDSNLYLFCANAPLHKADIYGLTAVSLSMALETHSAALHPNKEEVFLVTRITITEPPENGSINVIQLKRPYGDQWSIDFDKQYGPYYIGTDEYKKYLTQNELGQSVLLVGDYPAGVHVNPIDFILFVVETHRRCGEWGTPVQVFRCVDKITILDSRAWSFLPERDQFCYSNTRYNQEDLAIPVLSELLRDRTWKIPKLCYLMLLLKQNENFHPLFCLVWIPRLRFMLS